MSKDDPAAVGETERLLSNPADAQRLRDSIRQLDEGGGAERPLLTEDGRSEP